MKKVILTLALVCVTVLAFGQNKLLRPRIEIAEVETEIDGAFTTELEVFYMNDENPRMYYLSLGHLGIGTDIISYQRDHPCKSHKKAVHFQSYGVQPPYHG